MAELPNSVPNPTPSPMPEAPKRPNNTFAWVIVLILIAIMVSGGVILYDRAKNQTTVSTTVGTTQPTTSTATPVTGKSSTNATQASAALSSSLGSIDDDINNVQAGTSSSNTVDQAPNL